MYIETADYQYDEFMSIFRVIVKMRVVPIKRRKRFQSIVYQILLFHCIAAKSRCSRDVSSSVAL